MRGRVTHDLPFDPDLGDLVSGEVAARRRAQDRDRRPIPRSRTAQWATVLAVSAGGALGGLARYGVEQAFLIGDDGWPWGIFVANTAGAFVLSIALVLILETWPPRRYLRPFVAIGFLGSFTTFSTWMLEVHDLAMAGRIGMATAYLVGSVLAGLAVATLGLLLGRALVGIRGTSRPTEETP